MTSAYANYLAGYAAGPAPGSAKRDYNLCYECTNFGDCAHWCPRHLAQPPPPPPPPPLPHRPGPECAGGYTSAYASSPPLPPLPADLPMATPRFPHFVPPADGFPLPPSPFPVYSTDASRHAPAPHGPPPLLPLPLPMHLAAYSGGPFYMIPDPRSPGGFVYSAEGCWGPGGSRYPGPASKPSASKSSASAPREPPKAPPNSKAPPKDATAPDVPRAPTAVGSQAPAESRAGPRFEPRSESQAKARAAPAEPRASAQPAAADSSQHRRSHEDSQPRAQPRAAPRAAPQAASQVAPQPAPQPAAQPASQAGPRANAPKCALHSSSEPSRQRSSHVDHQASSLALPVYINGPFEPALTMGRLGFVEGELARLRNHVEALETKLSASASPRSAESLYGDVYDAILPLAQIEGAIRAHKFDSVAERKRVRKRVKLLRAARSQFVRVNTANLRKILKKRVVKYFSAFPKVLAKIGMATPSLSVLMKQDSVEGSAAADDGRDDAMDDGDEVHEAHDSKAYHEAHDKAAHSNEAHGNEAHGNEAHGNEAHGNEAHGNEACEGAETHNASEDEAFEDEAYEDEAYEDEAYEDEAYEDEAYEDEAYEDEAYEGDEAYDSGAAREDSKANMDTFEDNQDAADVVEDDYVDCGARRGSPFEVVAAPK